MGIVSKIENDEHCWWQKIGVGNPRIGLLIKKLLIIITC